MKNRKLIALALAALMLAGCGGQKKKETTKAEEQKPTVTETTNQEGKKEEQSQATTETEKKTTTSNQSKKTEETTAPQTNSGASEKKPTASSSSTSSSTSRKAETVKTTSNKPSTASSSNPSANTSNKPTGSVNKTSSPAKKTATDQKTPSQAVSRKPAEKTQYLVNVPFINQAAEGAPNGCEVASLLQCLRGKGYARNIGYHYMLDHMPYANDGNPYHGFVDSPYNHYKKDCFQSIFPSALVPYGKKFGNVSNTSGYSTDQLINELKKGNSSVVYVTYNFKTPRWKKYHFGNIVDNMHVMTLTGYDTKSGKFRVMDPYKKGSYWVSGAVFKRSYNALKWAITVK